MKIQAKESKTFNGFGVALMQGDHIIDHFDGFAEKRAANNAVKFINSVIRYSREFVQNDVPRVVQIANGGYYVTMSAENEEGAEIFFSSGAFKTANTAARCGAICFLVLNILKGD